MKNLDFPTVLEKIRAYGEKFTGFVGRYRTVLTVAVACGAVLAAVMQTRSYLNPVRNETVYEETRTQVNVKSIDNDVVTKLEATQSDRTDSVDSDFVPGRDNPFDE